MSFKDYHFKQYVQQALEEIGFVNPTEVQKRLIPIVNSGRDLVGGIKNRFRENPHLFVAHF